ncbi:MAG TPA: MarR family transcriptional regulator [Bryobacteraceae bacterium]|nr:MarR family transcriptional regulator [Bryobacteraceae bacterium]
MSKEPELTRMVQELEEHLGAVRAILRKPVEAEFARGNLTAPQRSVMRALFHAEGLSLKELSRRVGLAHSTVSGIVDRLEQRGLAERQSNQEDRRASTIVVSQAVRQYMRDTFPAIARDPVTAALRRAQPSERTAILEGLRLLRRVLEPSA